MSRRAQQELEQAANAHELEERNDILLGENGDILARYRIPQEGNQVDYTL